jgi:phosphate transport system ATP-binding protein
VAEPAAVLETRGLTVTAGGRPLLRAVDLAVQRGEVLGLIGPSGVGKTTFLRSLNRLTDMVPGLAVAGEVRFEGRSIHHRGVDVDALRLRVGMIFQQPVLFPGSILQNVLFGLRRVRRVARGELPARAEQALRQVALWDEVAHRLHEPAAGLSAGQQQRLCLARALAVEPEVLLLDEPTSSLDPRSTELIEALVRELKGRRTVVLVTHNLDQAERVADRIACFALRDGAGELAECAACGDFFRRPAEPEAAGPPALRPQPAAVPLSEG